MKKIVVVLVLAIFTFVSCSDETTFFEIENPRVDFSVEENSAVLSNSIETDNNGILTIYFEHEISGKTDVISTDTTNDFHLNLVGQVERPAFDSTSNLTATHIDYQDNYAYVSYNTVGETFAGAVDVIDLTDPLTPVLASRMYMHDRDANIILYDEGYVYVLGSVDEENVFEATAGSYIAKIGVASGIIDVNNVTYFYQDGNTATGMTKMDNSFYVSSGVSGSLAKYDADTFLKSKEVMYDDLRSVASENGKLAILDAGTGVKILDSELNEVLSISTNTSFIVDAKRTMALTDDQLIVPEGELGAGVYDLSTGVLDERLPILVDPENIELSDKVTNAVAVNGDAILLANGGAGLAINVKNELIDLMGVVELSGSINYVISEGDYIFAASGRSGLQIISKIRTDESVVVSEGTYTIKSRNSSRVIGLESESFDDGANITQESLDGLAETEEWKLELLDSGAYVITSVYSGKAVQRSNTNVEQSEYLGEASQQWAIEPAVTDGYFYIRNLDNNKYMDVTGRKTTAGTNIITWKFHGGTNQQWQLEVVE